MRFAPASGDKETGAKAISAQAEVGNVKLVRGPWNDESLRVLENCPGGAHDDEVDALSGAHEHLAGASSGAIGNEHAGQLLSGQPPPLLSLGPFQPRVFTPRTWRF